jgi:hypothetical protein
MALELAYLAAVLVLGGVGLFVLATSKHESPLRLTPEDARTVARYGSAWLGGLLGGCVFSIKWLYHSIARGKWHLDRRAWRLFTPLISGTLAFALMALALSQALPILGTTVTDSLGAIAGVSFLLGYFSDNTVAALAAAADRVLGKRTSLRD